MVIVIGEFFKEGSWLQDERGQYNFGKIHSWPDLLDQEPDDRLVLVGDFLSLKQCDQMDRFLFKIWLFTSMTIG